MHKTIGILIFLASAIITSCSEQTVFDQYTSISSGWDKNQNIGYQFNISDTIQSHNLFLKIRTTEAYEFSNLFLIVDLRYPSGMIQKDTLEYLMANPEGKMLGHGYTSNKEHKLWYKGHNKSFVFPEKGLYQISISHANRKLQQVEGVQLLQGVIDVGFSIEKSIK